MIQLISDHCFTWYITQFQVEMTETELEDLAARSERGRLT